MLLLHLPCMLLHPCSFVLQGCSIRYINPLKKGLSSITKMGEIESAWLIPCMVLGINDNLYGLIFALRSMCRLSFSLCQDHLLIKAKLVSMCWSQGALLDLHLLESSSREEKCWVDQGFVRVDQLSRSSEDMPKSALPILVYGGASCESSPSKAQSRRWFAVRRWRSSPSTSCGLMRKAKVWSW